MRVHVDRSAAGEAIAVKITLRDEDGRTAEVQVAHVGPFGGLVVIAAGNVEQSTDSRGNLRVTVYPRK